MRKFAPLLLLLLHSSSCADFECFRFKLKAVVFLFFILFCKKFSVFNILYLMFSAELAPFFGSFCNFALYLF